MEFANARTLCPAEKKFRLPVGGYNSAATLFLFPLAVFLPRGDHNLAQIRNRA